MEKEIVVQNNIYGIIGLIFGIIGLIIHQFFSGIIFWSILLIMGIIGIILSIIQFRKGKSWIVIISLILNIIVALNGILGFALYLWAKSVIPST